EQRLKREVLVWTRVQHRNIHPLLGFWSQPSPRLISTWCRHGNLTDYLRSNPDLSRFEKTIQAARGLAYLHAQSPPICHADIKPENILVNDLREAVLSDFGLSRVMVELSLSTGLTTSDGPKGTHNYMAPEFFEVEGPRPTCESDVFAFGGLVLAVLSGRPPFAGLPSANIILSVVQGQHPKLDQHPPLKAEDSLWLLMVKCWAQKRDLRPPMIEVVNEVSPAS
ncbi:carbohydrate-binding module family 1 protein, partial [Tulasnella calospora MUT 4182]